VILGLELGIGIVKLALSSFWKHWFGLFISLVLIAITVTSIILLWNMYERGRIWKAFFAISCLATAFVFLFLLVPLMSWDFPMDSFPSGCKKKTNCTRVTTILDTNVRGSGLSCPMIPSSTNSVQDEVKSWVNSQARTGILEQTDSFLRARFVSAFWGFADDFYVQLTCQQNGSIAIWVQGESRLGIGDFNVNEYRVADFITAMNQYQFSDGKCTYM